MSPAQVKGLTVGQLQALDAGQVGSFTATQVSVLSGTQIAGSQKHKVATVLRECGRHWQRIAADPEAAARAPVFDESIPHR